MKKLTVAFRKCVYANASKFFPPSRTKYTLSQLEIKYRLIFLSAINPVFLTNNNSTRQAIYVYRNIVEISRTLCTSSFILVVLYHFNRIEGFYGDIMTPTTVKHT